MAFVGSNNALAWAHFRLRGGWTRSFTVTGAAIALLAAILITTYRLNPAEATRILWGWTTGLLVLQAACLVLYIPGRIGAIVRSDVQSKMIESHRLMPLPPMHAVAGYILGAATQPLVFCGGLFVFGGLVAAGAGVALPRWAFANAVLLAFAAFTWVVTAYTSLGGRFGGGVLAALIMIPYLTQGLAIALLPGMTVILSPIIGQSIFDLRTAGITLPAPYAIAFAAQAFFGTICFIGAAREYRSPVEISLDTILGLCFLLGWVAVSCAGLRAWEDFRPRGWSPGDVDTPLQIVASLITAMLIAIAPLAANAQERNRWRRHVALRDPYPMRQPIPLAAVLAVAVLAMLAIPFAPKDFPVPSWHLLTSTAVIAAVALLGIYFLFDWAYAFTARAGSGAVVWIIATWGVPIAIDWARYSLGKFGQAEPIAWFSTCSPAGALIVLWTKDAGDLWAGIGVQILVALIPITLWAITFAPWRGEKE